MGGPSGAENQICQLKFVVKAWRKNRTFFIVFSGLGRRMARNATDRFLPSWKPAAARDAERHRPHPTTVETKGRARLCALFASTFFQTSVGVSRCDARRRVSSLSAGVSGFPIGPHMRLPWVKARTRWGLSGEARVTGPSLRQDAPCYTYLPHGGLATPEYLQQTCT